jgi:intein/homing endonuclease
MGVAIATRPDRDPPANALPYCYHALRYAVDYMRQRRMTVVDLERDMAVREQVLAALRQHDGILFFGCVTGDTVVPLPDGRIVQVSELATPAAVFSVHVEGSLKHPNSKKAAVITADVATHVIFKGVREVWKIETPFMEIEATPDHEFFVRSPDPREGARAAWKPLSQIKPGDKILVATKLPFAPTANPPLTVEQAQALGYYAGDGTMYIREGRTWQARLTDVAAKEEYAELFKRAFGVRPIDKGRRGFLICSKRLVKLIEGLELGVKSPYRDVPETVLRSPLEHQVAFISGLLDADGYVYPADGKIALYSVSERLLRKLQLLLLRFGILSKIYWSDRAGRPIVKGGKLSGVIRHKLGELAVFGANAYKLARLLTPLNEEKRRALGELVERYERLTRKQSPRGLSRVNEYLGFLRVTRIVRIGVKPVYDLVVSHNHNFIANGIVAHNCGHGSPDTFTGQYVRRIFWACDNAELAGRVVYLLSCETGQRLGPDIISKGGRAYVGYRTLFGFYLPDSRRPEDVMNDPKSRAFFEPVVTLLNALADGRTIGEAHRLSIERWNYWIEYWSRQRGGSKIVQWLVNDRDGQVLLGDASARVNIALRLPLLPLPAVMAFVASAGAAFAASG